MIKLMYILKRREGMSREEFRDYWLKTHAPLVLKMPKLRKYVVNVSSGDSEFDGVAELWFDTADDMDMALKSEEGKAVVKDAGNFVSKAYVLTVEEHSIL